MVPINEYGILKPKNLIWNYKDDFHLHYERLPMIMFVLKHQNDSTKFYIMSTIW